MSSADEHIDKNPDGVRAVDRALDILLAFRQGDGSLTAGDLLKRVDLSRPTLYRLLRTLEQRGFIATSGDPRRYQLGPSVGHLSYVWNQDFNMADLARPAMHDLWVRTGETVSLLLHKGQDRIIVAELPSAQPLSFKRGVGHSASVVVGASGRAILAFVPKPETYVEGQIPTVERTSYLDDLKKIRAQGYAVSREELIKGAVAVAVPVMNRHMQVLGSLAVYGPSARIDEEMVKKYAKWLQDASRDIAAKLG